MTLKANANVGSRAGVKRRIMRRLAIDEISAVDRPAQTGAKALLLKREDGGAVAKRTRLTTSYDGHQHLILDNEDAPHGMTSWEVGKNGRGHSHPYVRNEDGSITIGEADGHAHEVLYPVAKADDNPEQESETMTKEELEALEKRLAKALKMAELTDAEKAFMAGLADDAAKDAFLNKSADERKADMAKADEAAKADEEAKKRASGGDEVVYTDTAGNKYFKSDDQRLVNLVKLQDKKVREAEELKKRVEEQEFEKRAQSELSHLPGSAKVRAALLKAVEGIGDEELRKGALAAIKAQNKALAGAFKRSGTSVAKSEDDLKLEDDPEAKLDALAKKRASEKSIPYAKAYQEVLETPEGRELYSQAVNREDDEVEYVFEEDGETAESEAA